MNKRIAKSWDFWGNYLANCLWIWKVVELLFNPVKHADFSEVKDNDRGGTGSKCPTFREKIAKISEIR